MERSGFFNANLVGTDYDRVYLADAFAKYFASFVGNGVFGGSGAELVVLANLVPNMGIQVQSGQGFINGYWYENDAPLAISLDIADGTNPRMDSVVLRWGNSERAINVVVKKGTPSSTPVAPTLLRNSDFYELQLCTVRVNAGVVSINQSNITDTRMNNAVCGFVHGLVQQFDTTLFGVQLQDFIDNYILQAGLDHDTFISFLQQTQDDATMQINDLIAQLEGLFDADAVAQLTLRITALEDWRALAETSLNTINMSLDAINTTLNAHAVRHSSGGADPITLASIGAASANHNHDAANITSGRIGVARMPTSTVANRILKVGGTANTDPFYGQANLTTDITGILGLGNGGLGFTATSVADARSKLGAPGFTLLWNTPFGSNNAAPFTVPNILNYHYLGFEAYGRIFIGYRPNPPGGQLSTYIDIDYSRLTGAGNQMTTIWSTIGINVNGTVGVVSYSMTFTGNGTNQTNLVVLNYNVDHIDRIWGLL